MMADEWNEGMTDYGDGDDGDGDGEYGDDCLQW
jgi:hypothetical protein